MACGVLLVVDKQICAFERWLIEHLATVTSSENAQVLRRFASWEVLPKLRARAEQKALTVAIRWGVSRQITQATGFLGWLADHELTLAACGQADIDAWIVGHRPHERHSLRPFPLWRMENKLTSPGQR